MTSMLAYYDLFLRGLRLVFVVAAAAMALVCLLDWLVRTRRISPFSAPARFARRTIDPLLAPIERRVLRSGGLPTHVPWWGLAAVVVGGIVLLSLLQFIGGQLAALRFAANSGPYGIFLFLVSAAFGLLQIAIMVRVISSWIPSLSPYSPWVRWAWALSEPILAPIRRLVPPLGSGIDLSPIIAYLLIGWVVAPLVMRLLT